MNELVLKNRIRHQAKKSLDAFFESRDYEQVETPTLVTCPGSEVHLRYFQTNWQDYQNYGLDKYLRSSPELHMKQFLASGLERIYQLELALETQASTETGTIPSSPCSSFTGHTLT